ncbi:MAG: family N-acetyltransferase [Paenibacillaceae bacterium]|jgi:GNAT superfamily N-acetyltransferase|nr:family N-acetyltransferase [Paenibacillaceae bacterium]
MVLPVLTEDMAKRIIQSETDYLTSRISSIGEKNGNPEGVEIRNYGQTTAFYIRTMPWGLFNSVKGFSQEEAASLEEIIAFYRERNRSFQLDIDPPGTGPECLRILAEQGLYQTGFHSVLYGSPSSAPPKLPSTIKIIEMEQEADFDLYAGVHCVGSGMDIAHKHHFASNNIGLLNRPGWKLYLALWDGSPAAVAMMHTSRNTASFTLAATAPEFRRKGLHTALLHWRLHEAYKAGCGLVVAQASFGSSSQHNMERAGLQLAWTRAVWAPLPI